MIVDIHAHYFPKEYNDTAPAHRRAQPAGGRAADHGAADAERRSRGHSRHACSRWKRPRCSCRCSRRPRARPTPRRKPTPSRRRGSINDAYADLARKYPGRFNAVVSLPLPHIDASLREMERGPRPARHARRVDDVLVLRSLDRGGGVRAALPGDEPAPDRAELPPDPERHLLADDQRLRIHRVRRRLARGRRHRPAPDRPARAERFPNIKYVVPHLGGIIPMLLQRLDNQAPRQHPNLPERPSVTARRFYYDIVGHGSQAGAALRLEGVRRRPPRGRQRLSGPARVTRAYRQNFFYLRESILPPEDVDKILHHNAQIVLGPPALAADVCSVTCGAAAAYYVWAP